MKHLARLLVGVSLLLIAVGGGCTASEDQPNASKTVAIEEKPRRYVPTSEVLVTRDSDEMPPRCHPGDVAGLITHFFAAFNRGELKALSSFIALNGFGWYSMTEGDPAKGGRHFFTEDPNRLLSYFEDRHQHGERLTLLLVDIGVDSPETVGIHFVIRRDADDLKRGWGGKQRIAEGKGEIDCASQRIRIWSAGMDPARGSEFPPYVAWSCPRPEGWDPTRGPIVACVRA